LNIKNYEFAVANLEKYGQLFEEGIISEMEYEQMKLQATQESLDILNKQLAQAEQGLNQAKLARNQASSGYTQANVGLNQAKDNLNTADDALDDLTVTAPASGYITVQNLTEKVIASNTSIAMTIDELDVIKVITSVTANQLSNIQVGEEVDVILSSTGASYKGLVKTIDLTADQRTMLYSVTVLVENKELNIKPGMFATVRLINGKAENAVSVPSDAVVVRDGKDIVFVQAGEKAIAKEVVKGLDTGFYTEILEGIEPGDIVITKGVGLIDETTVIKVVRGDE
jgi:RND family efflux transporter MFP subunit